MLILGSRRRYRPVTSAAPDSLIFREEWNYDDLTAALAANDGSNPVHGGNIGSYFNGHPLTYAAQFGSSTGWQAAAYGIEADATFTKCLKARQWGRDEFSVLAGVDAANSCPTPRVSWTFPAAYPSIWSRRYIRLGVAADHFSGVRGWTNVNDGSSSYKMVGDEYGTNFAGSGSNQSRLIQEVTSFGFYNPNNGSATETLLSSTAWRHAGGSLFPLTLPISTTGNGDAWYVIDRCYLRLGAQECVMGVFARKCNYRDGTPVSITHTSTPAAYANLTEGDYRALVFRYTAANVPNGMLVLGWGYNMNGRIDYSQNLYYGPVEARDASIELDPYGLLAMVGVTP